MIKKVVLLVAILAAFSVGTAFAAEIDSLSSGLETTLPPTAVFVNPGGLGDALVYGYYNVRDGNTTIFTVTNTDQTFGARVRIRFREAATINVAANKGCRNGSQEVLDFDICLSEGDMWSGQIVSNGNDGATLISSDTDTSVEVGENDVVIFPTAFPNGVPFKFQPDVPNVTADMTREGYFEVIAERAMRHCTTAEISAGTCTCGTMMDIVGQDVDNTLMGHAYIVNTGTTATYAYSATALADFTSVDITPSPKFGGDAPNLADQSETGDVTAVNFAITKANVFSIYDLEAGIGGGSNAIITFPLKWKTHGENTTTPACTATNVGADIFDDPSVLIALWDDQENAPTVTGCRFSPCPKGSLTSLPHEVNVLNINGSNLFVSDVVTTVNTNFDFGWMTIDFVNNGSGVAPSPAHATTVSSLGTATSNGLPAVGYMLHSFNGGEFSAMLPLQYNTNVQ